jgi:hypothetical protein
MRCPVSDQTVPTEHAHRWRIEGQGGATSQATCACGAEKAFQNGWGRDSSSWAPSRKPPGRPLPPRSRV